MANNRAPLDEFAARRAVVAAGLEERKLDALLVAFSPNLRYLTGFTCSNGNLLITPQRAILFTDPRYTIQASNEAGCEVRIAKGPLVNDIVTESHPPRMKLMPASAMNRRA